MHQNLDNDRILTLPFFNAEQVGFDAADLERDIINERLQKDVVSRWSMFMVWLIADFELTTARSIWEATSSHSRQGACDSFHTFEYNT